MEQTLRKARWRLIMGSGAEQICGGLSQEEMEQDECLGFLYDRQYGDERNVRGSNSDGKRSGGLEASQLTVPDWINRVHELFPQKTVERLEKDALERYQLDEMVTNPEVIGRAEPNQTLLKAVLRTKHLMNQEVLAMARELVRRVTQQLADALMKEVKQAFQGSLDRHRRSHLKIAKNFDIEATIRHNMKNYNPQLGGMVIQQPLFFSRVRKQTDRWHVIVLVDQSGSMVDSVIHSAITASIFYSMPCMRTSLCAFDTEVVDMSQDCTDPVETLMRVQLGGGTDIAKAMQYGQSLISQPSKTILVLITDFYEGGSVSQLQQTTKALAESGVHLLGLAALDQRADPNYDHVLAQRLANLGMQIGAMTPGELAAWVADLIR